MINDKNNVFDFTGENSVFLSPYFLFGVARLKAMELGVCLQDFAGENTRMSTDSIFKEESESDKNSSIIRKKVDNLQCIKYFL